MLDHKLQHVDHQVAVSCGDVKLLLLLLKVLRIHQASYQVLSDISMRLSNLGPKLTRISPNISSVLSSSFILKVSYSATSRLTLTCLTFAVLSYAKLNTSISLLQSSIHQPCLVE